MSVQTKSSERRFRTLARRPAIPRRAIVDRPAAPTNAARPAQQPARPRNGTPSVNNVEVTQETLNYHRFLLEAILTQAQPTSRILDFGAGGGEFAIPLQQLHLDVTAVEPDASRRDRLLAAGVRTSASIAELRGGRFDLIYSLDVAAHLDIDVGILRELHDRMVDDARLLLHVPAFMMLASRNGAQASRVQRYTRRRLCRTARAAGFHVERAHYVDSLGCVAALLFKLFTGSSRPSSTARRVYDRSLLPVSLAMDVFTRRCFGRNLLFIARKG